MQRLGQHSGILELTHLAVNFHDQSEGQMTTFTTEDRINAVRGAGNDAEMSYADIAKEMGVSKTYVQMIEESALEKLRKKLIWEHDIFKIKDIIWRIVAKSYLI